MIPILPFQRGDFYRKNVSVMPVAINAAPLSKPIMEFIGAGRNSTAKDALQYAQPEPRKNPENTRSTIPRLQQPHRYLIVVHFVGSNSSQRNRIPSFST
jgi:hypothetical protein